MRLSLTAKILAFILSGITYVCLADEKPNIVIILTDDQGYAGKLQSTLSTRGQYS